MAYDIKKQSLFCLSTLEGADQLLAVDHWFDFLRKQS